MTNTDFDYDDLPETDPDGPRQQTFDGESGGVQVTGEQPDMVTLEPEPSGLGGLDLLERAMSEAEETPDLYPVPLPKLDGIRLMVDIVIDGKDWGKWQILSLPAPQRKNPRKANPADMDQALLSRIVISKTAKHLEYRDSNGQWHPIVGRDGIPLGLDSDELLDRFKILSERELVNKLFSKRDAWIIRAGQNILAAAGYGDEADEENALREAENPTD